MYINLFTIVKVIYNIFVNLAKRANLPGFRNSQIFKIFQKCHVCKICQFGKKGKFARFLGIVKKSKMNNFYQRLFQKLQN